MTFDSRPVHPPSRHPGDGNPCALPPNLATSLQHPVIPLEMPLALQLVRKAKVLARTGMCNSSLYNAIVAGTFPAPVQTGPRTVAWVESEVSDWIEARIAERDARLDKQVGRYTSQTRDARGMRA